ncbi:signal peptidase complex subunit 3-like isoform X2 [Mustelus asterias]
MDLGMDYSTKCQFKPENNMKITPETEYATEKNTLNQVVLWDKILQRGENPRLNLPNVSPKYLFLDDGNGLKGNQNVSLSLSWNIVPNAGILYLIPASGQKVIPLPENYDNLRSC